MRLARLAAAVAAAALAGTTPLALADPVPSPTPSVTTSGLPVALTLTGLTPLAPQPGDTLVVRGSAYNLSGTPVTNLSVQLEVSQTKVGSRGQFDDYAAVPDGAPPAGAVAPPSQTPVLATSSLPAGGTDAFEVSVPVDDLNLPQAWQVYELAIVISGDTVLGHVEVGRLRTFLPWAPLGVPGTGLPTRVAWVWPLADRPHRTGATEWTDDVLATELQPAGRLGRLLAAGAAAQIQQPPPEPTPRPRKHHRHRPPKPVAPKQPQPTVSPVPVTWVIDPALVDDATAMAAGYSVGEGAGQHRGAGQATARTWLEALKRATAGAALFGLPYADPDVAAAARAGLGTEVQVATTAGDALLSHTLGQSPLPYAWPPDGLADQRTLDTLFAAGETTVVLDSQALPVAGGPPSETPGAHTTVRSRDGNLDALLSDHTLNLVVDDGAHSATAGRLAVQRLLSELLMVQAELPSDQRSLVITPSRRWAPTASYAAAVLSDTGRVPWVEPVTLAQVAAGPVYDKVQRGPLYYPATERARQLPRTYLTRVKAIKQRVDAFAAILPFGDPQARAFDAGVLRLLSSAWRADPAAARAARLRFAHQVEATMNRVHITSHEGSLVTLTSHSGTVPVTVANDLDSPVRVSVRIAPSGPLVVRGGGITRTIPPHRQVPVDVHATAKTSGVFPLSVALYTPDGHQRYGQRVQLLVRSTAYGTTALLITGGATAVLLLTVIARLVRRARSARRSASSPA